MKKAILITSLVLSLFTAPMVLAETVNINTADVKALDTLDGIGQKKAEAIVAYRTEHGEFKTLEDLKEVSGIGDKLFDKIKEDIALTDGTATVADKSTEKSAKADVAKTDSVSEKTEAKADVKDDKAVAKDEKAAEKADATVKTDKVSDKAAPKADKS
jgi:competence protein ComEA